MQSKYYCAYTLIRTTLSHTAESGSLTNAHAHFHSLNWQRNNFGVFLCFLCVSLLFFGSQSISHATIQQALAKRMVICARAPILLSICLTHTRWLYTTYTDVRYVRIFFAFSQRSLSLSLSRQRQLCGCVRRRAAAVGSPFSAHTTRFKSICQKICLSRFAVYAWACLCALHACMCVMSECLMNGSKMCAMWFLWLGFRNARSAVRLGSCLGAFSNIYVPSFGTCNRRHSHFSCNHMRTGHVFIERRVRPFQSRIFMLFSASCFTNCSHLQHALLICLCPNSIELSRAKVVERNHFACASGGHWTHPTWHHTPLSQSTVLPLFELLSHIFITYTFSYLKPSHLLHKHFTNPQRKCIRHTLRPVTQSHWTNRFTASSCRRSNIRQIYFVRLWRINWFWDYFAFR